MCFNPKCYLCRHTYLKSFCKVTAEVYNESVEEYIYGDMEIKRLLVSDIKRKSRVLIIIILTLFLF